MKVNYWLCLLALGCALAIAEELPSPRTHAFYYSWYGNPDTDGHWRQWNHAVAARTPEQKHTHVPSEDIGANFYPAIGLYSSKNPKVVATHMQQMKRAGIGVVCTTWWGVKDFSNEALPGLLDAAANAGLTVNIHIEPFAGRNAATTREAIVYLIDRFGDHPGLYHYEGRPMFYVYDSYLTPPEEWATVLAPDGEHTIRGTEYDSVVIGLWVREDDGPKLKAGHFDGYYTYFGINEFTYGSTWKNWPTLAAFANENDMLFIACPGPGYEDRSIRPWNGANFRAREDGAYYDRAMAAAINSEPDFIGISTFNEWHEGTQIEPAVPIVNDLRTYLDYESRDPEWYLDRTRHWLEKWGKREE